MIPPRTALYLYDTYNASQRDAQVERARRARKLNSHPPRPHAGQRICSTECGPCTQWARDIVASRSPAGDGS